MFPRAVLEDLKDLENTPELLRRIMPTEAEIIETEFRKEIRELLNKDIGSVVGEKRDITIPSETYVIRKSFIHGTERESDLTGADVAVEIVGKKLFLCQAKKETIQWNSTGTYIASRHFKFDRAQMATLIWLNDEILHRIYGSSELWLSNVHSLSFKVPCFYKLIFLSAPQIKPSAPGQISVAEERYIPVKQAQLILGARKSAPVDDFKTGFLPDEFQQALADCDAGCEDLMDEILKRKIFKQFSLVSSHLVVLFNIRSKVAHVAQFNT